MGYFPAGFLPVLAGRERFARGHWAKEPTGVEVQPELSLSSR